MLHSDDDPRAGLINAIPADHQTWSVGAVARLARRSDQFRSIILYECDLDGGVESLFPEGVAWPLLDQISIDECGELTSLRHLSLKSVEGGELLVNAISSAPLLERLETLTLHATAGVEELVGALAARTLPLLRRLEHSCNRASVPRKVLARLERDGTVF